MNRREQLIENYEDALFAVLMDKVAEEEGAKLREENRRLKEDPDAAVPEHVDAVARETIRKAFAGQKRRSALKTIGRVVNKVAVVVLICSVLFATAYAAFPEVQLRTLNLLIQSSDVASKLTWQQVRKKAATLIKTLDALYYVDTQYRIFDLSSLQLQIRVKTNMGDG